jgi:replicative DNA helicase
MSVDWVDEVLHDDGQSQSEGLVEDWSASGHDGGATVMWEPPMPLGSSRDLVPFPVDALPSWLADQVHALAEFTQTPVDLAACVALGVVSAAIGGRVDVEVRGSWREPVNIYTICSLPPGSRKSAVFADLTVPLLEAEQELIAKIQPRVVEADTQLRIAQKDAEHALKLAATAAGDKDAAIADAIAAAQRAESAAIPVLPRIVADDITPEAAASLLAEQAGRLAVLSAEGGIFATLAGRYSTTPNLEAFLKGHSGDLLRVDRKGRPPEHVDRPALTLGLCVQPGVLRDIAQMPGFRDRGLLARLLYSLPPNLVGYRRIGAAEVPHAVRSAYRERVGELVGSIWTLDERAVLTLTPDAAELVIRAEMEMEPRLRDDGDLHAVVDWASKLIGATVRIAGILHVAEHVRDNWRKPIDADTMNAAIQIGRYFTAHALAAFDLMGSDPVTEGANAILAWIERTHASSFTKRELFSGFSRSRFRRASDLDAPLGLLEDHGYIRREVEQSASPGGGRRPSPSYTVNPLCLPR